MVDSRETTKASEVPKENEGDIDMVKPIRAQKPLAGNQAGTIRVGERVNYLSCITTITTTTIIITLSSCSQGERLLQQPSLYADSIRFNAHHIATYIRGTTYLWQASTDNLSV